MSDSELIDRQAALQAEGAGVLASLGTLCQGVGTPGGASTCRAGCTTTTPA